MPSSSNNDDPNDNSPSLAKDPSDAFAGMAAEVRGADKKWYSINWEFLKEYKILYSVTACLSFLLLTIFGAVTMIVTDDCYIEQSEGRCCECLDLNETRQVGQSMPTMRGYNSIFYGAVMIANSFFGFYYILIGVKTENKYQLSCMIVTQVLEVARALFDTWFETNPSLKDRFLAREILAYSSLGLLIISGLLIPPLYKQFGWSIFRRGGVLKPVRERYKIYQMFRAFNRLDVQSSSLLFLVFGLYLHISSSTNGVWVFVTIIVCDFLASRYLVRYIKREVTVGFYISMVAKSFVVIWWLIITAEYFACRGRYLESLDFFKKLWDMNPYPSYHSVKHAYNGVGCLAPNTHHDDRTLELIVMNLAQAIFFRVGSMIYGVRVAARFGGGLKAVFYKELADANKMSENEEGETKRPEGGLAIKFVATKKKAGAGRKTKRGAAGSSLEDQEMESSSTLGGSSSSTTDYNKYSEAGSTNNNNGEDEEEYEDAMLAEHGVSRREMEDDAAW